MRSAFLARLALMATFVVVAAGCSSNKGKVEETTWMSTAMTENGVEIPAGARRLQLQRDGQLFYTISGKLYRGNYALGMGPAVTFTLDEDMDGRKIHPYKLVISGDQLTLTGADGKVVTFDKLSKAAAAQSKSPGPAAASPPLDITAKPIEPKK
jgi:hypothetical protein